MAELGTNVSGVICGAINEGATLNDRPDPALRARDDSEQVAIETVHIGDYVFLDARARPASARCVIRKCAKANERTSRIVGWLLELTGGQLAWWSPGELVWRRRGAQHA